MTERGQITIPKAIRERFGFSPSVEVEVKVRGGVVIVEPVLESTGAASGLSRWRGALRKEMLADGYSSTRELMKELRGR